MKSTSGAHYIGLDHVRALAAFLVVVWHFTHAGIGKPSPLEGAPTLFPLALLDEGHTGVALFMTLSGYLFAKLIDGRPISYGAFLWNRALRLLPLLSLVILLQGIRNYRYTGGELYGYWSSVAKGLVLPTLPNGGWSITAEVHFYVVLPFLLIVVCKRYLFVSLILIAVCLRAALYVQAGEVQTLAYFTIIGRFDQFALGIFLFHARNVMTGRHLAAATVFIAFTAFYWWFDVIGGFLDTKYSWLWILIPTIEGAAYALLIAWYDQSFRHSSVGASRVLARFGTLSYSIYLLHFFFFEKAADVVHKHVMDLTNFYVATAWAVAFFLFMYIPAALSFRFIESPALKLRRPYVLSRVVAQT